jgi:hypothetical protein
MEGAREAGSFSRLPNAGQEIFRLPGFLICTWTLVNELNVKSFILHCFTGVVAGAVALTGYVISGCSLSKFAPSSRPLSQPLSRAKLRVFISISISISTPVHQTPH